MHPRRAPTSRLFVEPAASSPTQWVDAPPSMSGGLSSEGKEVRAPGNTNRHTPSALMPGVDILGGGCPPPQPPPPSAPDDDYDYDLPV